jgi:hypothetical protein
MHPKVRARVAEVLEQRHQQGYDIVVEEHHDQGYFARLIEKWRSDKDGPTDRVIESELAARNLYGILLVQFEGSDANPTRRVVNEIIHSTRPDAPQRRRDSVPAPPANSLAYLLINDHPAKADLAVAARIEQLLRACREKGWNLQMNDDAEVAVRRFLPAGPIDAEEPMSPMFHAALARHRFAGVLKIDAKPGEGPAEDRIALTRIDGDSSAIAEDEGETVSSPSSSLADHRYEHSANAMNGTLVGSR